MDIPTFGCEASISRANLTRTPKFTSGTDKNICTVRIALEYLGTGKKSFKVSTYNLVDGDKLNIATTSLNMYLYDQQQPNGMLRNSIQPKGSHIDKDNKKQQSDVVIIAVIVGTWLFIAIGVVASLCYYQRQKISQNNTANRTQVVNNDHRGKTCDGAIHGDTGDMYEQVDIDSQHSGTLNANDPDQLPSLVTPGHPIITPPGLDVVVIDNSELYATGGLRIAAGVDRPASTVIEVIDNSDLYNL